MSTTRHYLFGYGSLINRQSHTKTAPVKDCLPYTLLGYVRTWSNTGAVDTWSPVNIYAKPQAKCNGVLMELTEQDLACFDDREGRYQRHKISPLNLSTQIDLTLDPEDNFWTFYYEQASAPSEKTPILQSYVDIVLSGCLDISESFAKEFIESTSRWDFAWINDRQAPRYNIGNVGSERLKRIDNLLEEFLGEALSKCKLATTN